MQGGKKEIVLLVFTGKLILCSEEKDNYFILSKGLKTNSGTI